MKQCPLCQQTYTDDTLNFCLNDGGNLRQVNNDPPPTVFMNQARVTSPANWSQTAPPTAWQNQQISPNQSFLTPPARIIQNQTLPTISLVIGIFSIVLSICCYAGIPLGAAGLITGYLGLNNFNRDPVQFGGRTLAIGGMITGVIGFAISILLLLIVVIKR